jgi:hypothetical protein
MRTIGIELDDAAFGQSGIGEQAGLARGIVALFRHGVDLCSG